MTRAISLFVAAGVCASASVQAAPKCALPAVHQHETVIMDNQYPQKGTPWGQRPAVILGVFGENDPWSLNGPEATRLGDAYSFGLTTWTIGAASDFDGDGDCDLAWTRMVAGTPNTLQMTVTLTPNGDDAQFLVPAEDPPPSQVVTFGETWELVGSGHFLNAAGGPDPEPGGGAVTKADVVLCDWATGQLSIWTDVEHLQGQHLVNGAAGAGARALGVIDLVRPSVDVMSEVIWRYGLATPLSYTTFAPQAGGLTATGEYPMLSPADANWWLRATGDFNGDGWEDLLFQNLPNTERSVIWLMAEGTRLSGLFTNPNMLGLGGPAPIDGQPRVIVAPR